MAKQWQQWQNGSEISGSVAAAMAASSAKACQLAAKYHRKRKWRVSANGESNQRNGGISSMWRRLSSASARHQHAAKAVIASMAKA